MVLIIPNGALASWVYSTEKYDQDNQLTYAQAFQKHKFAVILIFYLFQNILKKYEDKNPARREDLEDLNKAEAEVGGPISQEKCDDAIKTTQRGLLSPSTRAAITKNGDINNVLSYAQNNLSFTKRKTYE